MAKAPALRDNDLLAAVPRRIRILTAIRRHPASIGRTEHHRALEVRSGAALIGAEIDRARRYERPLSVMWVPIATRTSAELLRGVIRDTDQTAPGRDGVIVVLPETDPTGVRVCVERVAAAVGVPDSSIRVVNFPDDALTAGRLLELLDDRPGPIRQGQAAGAEDAA